MMISFPAGPPQTSPCYQLHQPLMPHNVWSDPRRRAYAKGEWCCFAFRSPSGCSKGEARCVSAGWQQEGHTASECSHQNPLVVCKLLSVNFIMHIEMIFKRHWDTLITLNCGNVSEGQVRGGFCRHRGSSSWSGVGVQGMCFAVLHSVFDVLILVLVAVLPWCYDAVGKNIQPVNKLTPTRGTGIRGLMRGMATHLQGNQELLVVRDKVGRHPGELGVSKSMECDIFPSVLWHCWLGDRKGKTGCWFVDGGDLTGAFHAF